MEERAQRSEKAEAFLLTEVERLRGERDASIAREAQMRANMESYNGDVVFSDRATLQADIAALRVKIDESQRIRDTYYEQSVEAVRVEKDLRAVLTDALTSRQAAGFDYDAWAVRARAALKGRHV